jgi:hypothetical protein
VNHGRMNFNLLATRLKAKILAEKRHHMILKASTESKPGGTDRQFQGENLAHESRIKRR